MSMVEKMFRFRIFSRLVGSVYDAESVQSSQASVRRNLDVRLERVTKATLNGEDGWFLKLVKEDPICALNVIKECSKDDD